MDDDRIYVLFKIYREIMDIAWRLRDCIREPEIHRMVIDIQTKTSELFGYVLELLNILIE